MPSPQGVAMAFAMMQAAELKHRVETADAEDQALAVYGEALRHVDDDLLRRATIRHIRESKWWATPAELLEVARLEGNEMAKEREASEQRARLTADEHVLPEEEVIRAMKEIARKLDGSSLPVDERPRGGTVPGVPPRTRHRSPGPGPGTGSPAP